MKRGLVLAMLLLGCDPGGPKEPEASEMTLEIENPLKIEAQAALRATLVWTYATSSGMRFATTDDVPVDSAKRGALLPLHMPPDSVKSRLHPVDAASFPPQIEAAIHRPRLVIYEDVDGNARFEPALFDETGPDRVVGVDLMNIQLGAILNLENVLERMPIEQIGNFYETSGGRFSPFVRVSPLSPLMMFEPWQSTASIVLDDSEFPAESLECLRPQVGTSKESQSTAIVDTGVDPAICASLVDTCTTAPLSTLAEPEIIINESTSTFRDATCNRVAPLEALIIAKGVIHCTSCSCFGQIDTTAYVANQAALPSWWPCGKSVTYCDGATSVLEYDRSCASN